MDEPLRMNNLVLFMKKNDPDAYVLGNVRDDPRLSGIEEGARVKISVLLVETWDGERFFDRHAEEQTFLVNVNGIRRMTSLGEPPVKNDMVGFFVDIVDDNAETEDQKGGQNGLL